MIIIQARSPLIITIASMFTQLTLYIILYRAVFQLESLLFYSRNGGGYFVDVIIRECV